MDRAAVPEVHEGSGVALVTALALGELDVPHPAATTTAAAITAALADRRFDAVAENRVGSWTAVGASPAQQCGGQDHDAYVDD